MLILRLVVACVLATVVAVLWLPGVSEFLCLLKRRRPVGPEREPGGELPRLLFLVPAHDEEMLISGCVRSLLAVAYPPERRRVIVIADNCTDATAKIAAELGADVFERFDPELPGKPRAIAWALGRIELARWDACIIVDADSTVATGFAAGIAKLAPLNDIVFQPNNGVLNEAENWLTRLGGLLGRCRFQVTYPLKQSAGLNCPISNGMGFGTNLLIKDGWRSFSITEDIELFAVYTEAGVPIRHASTADLFSQEARSLRQSATQRRRWMAGRISTLMDWAPRLLRSPNIGWHQKIDALAEVALPAPVLHLLAAGASAVVAVVVVRGELGRWIAITAVASLSAIAITTMAAIARHPQPWRTILSFFMLPLYTVWRLRVILATFGSLGDTSWRRTARSAPHVASPLPMADTQG